MNLDIKPIKNKHGRKIKLTKLMEDGIIPGFNQGSIVLVGSVKSGKSTLLSNLLGDDRFYGKYFNNEDKYLFSPTATYDEIAGELGVPEENRISEDMIRELKDLIDDQTDEVERKGKYKARKLCIIFDDLSSCKKLQRSPVFEKLFTTNRHINAMVFCAVHKISALTRLCRLQCAHIMFFSAPRSEIDILCEEFCAQGMTKKQMCKLIQYATTPDQKNKKPFLYINLTTEPNKRYRKNFDTLLDLTGRN